MLDDLSKVLTEALEQHRVKTREFLTVKVQDSLQVGGSRFSKGRGLFADLDKMPVSVLTTAHNAATTEGPGTSSPATKDIEKEGQSHVSARQTRQNPRPQRSCVRKHLWIGGMTDGRNDSLDKSYKGRKRR